MSAVHSHIVVRTKIRRFGRIDAYYLVDDEVGQYLTKHLNRATPFGCIDEASYCSLTLLNQQNRDSSIDYLMVLDPVIARLPC